MLRIYYTGPYIRGYTSNVPAYVSPNESSYARGWGRTIVTPAKPIIPEAKRLEHIRLQYLDGIPLAEFHRLLTQTDDYRISYAGVRNYHTNRKAPVDYYAQVSRVFGVRLEWLLFGEGEVTDSEADAKEAGLDPPEWVGILPKAAPTVWHPSDQVSRAAFLECMRKLDLARPGGRPLSLEEREDLARVIDTLVAGTLWILRGDKHVPKDCVRSILLALIQGLPGPKKGSTHKEIMKRMKM
jgi:hypothetical protein